jgi:hypothetical protein
MDLAVGDHILYGKYAGSEINLIGEEYLIVREDDVLGVVEGAVVVEHIRTQSDVNYGFNAETTQYEDLVTAGVIDPTKVTRSALQTPAPSPRSCSRRKLWFVNPTRNNTLLCGILAKDRNSVSRTAV